MGIYLIPIRYLVLILITSPLLNKKMQKQYKNIKPQLRQVEICDRHNRTQKQIIKEYNC